MLKIREAVPDDLDEIIIMCEEHAIYERAEYKRSIAHKTDLAALIFSESKIICLVAERNGQLVGYATCIEQVATWTAKYYLYMDCLFIRESYRSRGMGTLIMREIVEIMEKRGLTEVQWQTPSDNLQAIKFYSKMGAKQFSKSRFIWKP